MNLDRIMKAYMLQRAIKEATNASRVLKRNLRKVDWDAGLHRIGLTTHRPVRTGFGMVSMLCLGACVGGVAALLFAPKKGVELRHDLAHRINRQVSFGMEQAQQKLEQTQQKLETSPTARV